MKRMPERTNLGAALSTTIHALIAQAEEPERGHDRTVMGFALPSWQRGSVWSREQQIRFVESAWKGLPLGTYTVNRQKSVTTDPALCGILIDGQQRITAIEAYLRGDFPVFGARWSEVHPDDRRAFKMTKFASYEKDFGSDAEMRAYYDLMNFGGVSHAPADAASFDPDLLSRSVLRRMAGITVDSKTDPRWVMDVSDADPDIGHMGDCLEEIAPGANIAALLAAHRRAAILDEMAKVPALSGMIPEASRKVRKDVPNGPDLIAGP